MDKRSGNGAAGGIGAPFSEAECAKLDAILSTARAGDIPRAARMADEALAGGLTHPLLFNLSAANLENEGRLEEAAERLRAALVVSAQDPSALNALAIVLNRLERPAEALSHADALIRLQPNFAPAYIHRGMALQSLGHVAEADASYARALELQPGNLAALAGRASLAARRGAYAEARRYAEQVVRAEPQYPDSTLVLAEADLREGRLAEAEARIRELMKHPRLTPLESAAARGLLGDVLDAREKAREAFQAYAQANDILRRHYAKAYGAAGALEAARRQAEYFRAAPAWPPREAASKSPVAAHVFLIGFPRSGTTLLETALARNPRVETLPEREAFIDAMRAYLRTPADLDKLKVASIEELERYRELYWRRAREAGARMDGKVLLDKYPLNTLKLPLIAALFPDAKILFARRDPRDVVFSCFRRRFLMSAPMYEFLTLSGAADFYVAVMELAAHAGEKLGVRAHAVRHEAMVADFDKELKQVCAYIGLNWTDAMRDFAASVRKGGVATPSAAQLSSGLSREGVGAWKRYRNEMKPVLGVLKPWVERFGYRHE